MTYEDAKFVCHVRSAIFRESHPDKKFWKNHSVSLDDRIPDDWKSADDWREHDPREQSYEALA